MVAAGIMDPNGIVRTTPQDAVEAGSLLITAEAMQPGVRGPDPQPMERRVATPPQGRREA